MKQKQRVPKGEKYWFLAGNLKVKSTVEKDTIYDKSEWVNHNYFYTEEEANQMLKKLRAVLRGADVIEMPSEEEIENVAHKIGELIVEEAIIKGGSVKGYLISACKSMVEFFNSKIVK